MIALAALLVFAGPPPPSIHVEIPWAGATPAAIEAGVVRPLEAAVLGLADLAHLETTAEEGVARLHLRFAPGVAPRAAAERAADALRGVALPPEAEAPRVRRAPTGPIHLLAADPERADAARRALARLPGVLDIETCGLDERTVAITLDAARQAAYGVTFEEVAAALATPPGGAPLPPEALGDAALRANPLVRLSDVAQVQLERRADCTCLLDGRPRACFRVRVDGAPAWPEDLRPVAASARRTLRLPPAAAARPALGSGVTGLVWLPADGDGRWYTGEVGPPPPMPGVRVGPPEAVDAPTTHVWVIGADDAARAAALRMIEARWPAALGPPPAPPTLEARASASAATLGVTSADIARALRAATAGSPVGVARLGDGRAPIIVRAGPPPEEPADLAGLTLTTPQGARIPLSAVATLRAVAGPTPLRRRDGQRAERRLLPGVALEAARADLQALPLPAGVHLQVVAEPAR